MKFAFIKNNRVETIYFSKPKNIDVKEVPDDVFSGFIDNGDGTYSAPPAAPAVPATETLINRVQFKSMLAILGKSIDDVMNAIDAVISDETQNTIAKVKVTDSDRYARDNELFTILAPSLNLTDADIDAAWEQAVKI